MIVRMTRRLVAVLATLLLLAACSDGGSTESLTVEVDEATGEIDISAGEPGTSAPTTAPPVVVGDGAPTSTEDGGSVVLPAGVESDGVLVAAVVLATGDIEAALDAGLVTPAEVEAAVQAIQDGTLTDVVG